jgi:uncharacterized membrane protein
MEKTLFNLKPEKDSNLHQKWFRSLLAILLMLGIFFHFFNLDRKLFWHDEAYTSMRAAGYTRNELDIGLFQNTIFPARELQNYQNIKPGSTFKDTIHSLALEDPQHPPLYFLMARFWMEIFGGSRMASRSLPVIISLISLPFIYFLAIELFNSKLVAIIATILLSLSPFDILFAQTARQYSLLTLTAIASSFFLLQSLKVSNCKNWSLYTLACTIGFYTHPFFVLTLIGQIAFVVGSWLFDNLNKQKILFLAIAIAAIFLLYLPWTIVLLTNFQRALDTTDWSRFQVSFLYLLKLWILSFTSLFIDFDFGFDNVLTYALRLPFFIFSIASIYVVCRQTKRSTWLFILTSVVVPFLLLVLPDLISGGKRSAVTRYLIPCFPGIQLAVAYLVVRLLLTGKQLWRGLFAIAITLTIISCTMNGLSDTSWSKDLSYSNAKVANVINARSSPLLMSDRGDDWTNLGDLLSLSYLLDEDVRVFLISYPPDLKKIREVTAKETSDVLIFRPTGALFSGLKQSGDRLTNVLQEGRLWQLN